MITQETASRIWTCYREIEEGKKFLEELAERIKKAEDQTPLDPDGKLKTKCEFSLPLKDCGHYRLYGVNPKLSLSIVRAHIAEKERELVEANEQARIELGDSEVPQSIVNEAKDRDLDTPLAKAEGILRQYQPLPVLAPERSAPP